MCHPGRHMRKKKSKTKKERTNTTGPLDKRRACPRLIHVRGARTALSSYDKGPLLGALVLVLTKPCKRSSISDVSRSWPLLRAPRTHRTPKPNLNSVPQPQNGTYTACCCCCIHWISRLVWLFSLVCATAHHLTFVSLPILRTASSSAAPTCDLLDLPHLPT